MESLTYNTQYKTQLIQITDAVAEAVIRSGVRDGMVQLFTPHSTCGLFIYESEDPRLERDLLQTLHDLVPGGKNYGHVGGNAEAHIKASIMGCSVTVPVKEAKMLLGPWQGIFLGEFDGPRERTVHITVLK